MTTEEMIRASQCFGVAFDPTVIECKQCDVHLRCEHKCRMNQIAASSKRPMPTSLAEPEEILELDAPKAKPVADTNKSAQTSSAPAIRKKTVKDAVKSKSYSPDMPEFKGLTLTQLEQMVVERGGNLVDFEKYTSDNIRRMRMTMFLKSTYEL